MELFIGIIVVVLGLCCGSFVNMLVYRTAVKYELIKLKFNKIDRNRSVCDFCGKQLHWYENVPVISWLFLEGKSRCCGKKLPVSYPLTEAVTGLLFFVFFLLSGISGQTVLGLAAITLLVFLAVFDVRYMILPDFSEYILIGIAAVGLFFRQDWRQCLLSGLVAVIFFWFLSKLKIKGKQAMGNGDVPLALFTGLYLGWPLSLVAFYAAFISGAIVGGGLMMMKKKKGNSQIPFGPFLIFGTILAWWWGKTIIKMLYF